MGQFAELSLSLEVSTQTLLLLTAAATAATEMDKRALLCIGVCSR